MEISEERLSSLIILAMIMMSVDSGMLLIQNNDVHHSRFFYIP